MAMCCKSDISMIFAVLVLRVNDCRPYRFLKLLSFFSIYNNNRLYIGLYVLINLI